MANSHTNAYTNSHTNAYTNARVRKAELFALSRTRLESGKTKLSRLRNGLITRDAVRLRRAGQAARKLPARKLRSQAKAMRGAETMTSLDAMPAAQARTQRRVHGLFALAAFERQ